jgi:hypothetical protein
VFSASGCDKKSGCYLYQGGCGLHEDGVVRQVGVVCIKMGKGVWYAGLCSVLGVNCTVIISTQN